ncbi:GNAT family N-acetyltransferase [Salinibius halmophilus]|uniref:GNAT family N-acetyltransferase n=1 Tax=Salinibius halmophilus TaxID=1853216 RepID=UPI001314B435|nr:GNAT family N-acetyltransferase [Salinibius halmophilus]
MQLDIYDSIRQLANDWPNSDYPFIRYEFLAALERHNCTSDDTGWAPHHFAITTPQGKSVAPAYIKTHSFGEYVFDQPWAQYYQAHGYQYYPKLLLAIPFTPVNGPRAIGANQTELLQAIDQYLVDQRNVLSSHLLFAESSQRSLMQTHAVKRQDVQYHWFNNEYQHFDAYLEQLKSRKRKQIKASKRKIADAGVTIKRYRGEQLNEEKLALFYHCYHITYLKRGRMGYLNRGFFAELFETMADQLMLTVAYQHGAPIACALFFQDSNNLYGRYWGATTFVPELHFEVCYQQGIEYCIEQGLQHFDPGTQGEHKLLRGFTPVITESLHWLPDDPLLPEVKRWVDQMNAQAHQWYEEAQLYLPYKQS